MASGCEAPEWLEDDDLCPMTVPDEVPAWLLEGPSTDVEATCDCGCACAGEVPVAEPLRWAVPGCRDDDVVETAPAVGPLVAQLQALVARLDEVDPVLLPPGRARAEAEALLAVSQKLRVQQLARIEDVRDRQLFAGQGHRTTAAWLRSVAPDADGADRTLASRLGDLSHLAVALAEGRVSIAAARKIGTAMAKVRRHLDCADGLVDGLPGDEVVAAVVNDVVDLVCRDRFGLSGDDPARAGLLATLEKRTTAIRHSGAFQTEKVEQAFVLLAEHVSAKGLPAAIEELVLAVLPNLLEEREKAAQEKRALGLSRNEDGTWHLEGTLTPECGERLFAGLGAQARRDPANPVDTQLRERERDAQAEAEGRDRFTHPDPVPAWEAEALAAFGDPEPSLVPRSRSKRLHDAFDRLLSRYLGAGLGGSHDKVPVQVTVTLSHDRVEGRPGALPARGGSGRPLAASLVRRWWCDSHVTALLMTGGWIPLGIVHDARTLTGRERTASRTQFDHRCAGEGCCSGVPDPLVPLVAHHVIRFADGGRTSIDETLWVCPTLHHDLHTGKRTVRLRDGRLVDENGFVTDRKK